MVDQERQDLDEWLADTYTRAKANDDGRRVARKDLVFKSERQEDKALRDELREAIHSARRWSNATPDELIDAVLPVVKAHTQALGMAHIALGNDLTMARCRAEDAEDLLSSLREAVAHLADQLAQGTDAGFPSKEDAQRFPLSTTVALGRRSGLRDAARRLRSLLPQEGTEKEVR